MPAKEHPCGQLSQTAGGAGQERAEQGRAGSSLLCKNFKLLCKFHLPPRPPPRLQTVQQCRSKGALLGAWQSTNNRQHHVGSLARTKAPGKRHNSSGRSDFMPDFNYQYAPSTWSTCPPLPHPSSIHPSIHIEQWAQIISYAKRVVCSIHGAQWPGNFDWQCNILF